MSTKRALLVLSLVGAAQADTGCVGLMYHHVADNTPASTTISVDLFAQHLDYLAENQHTVIDLKTLESHLRNRTEFPEKCVFITFDDGYADVYENALPLLKQHAYPSTIFLPTQNIGEHSIQYMSHSQIQLAEDDMNVTFAGHSHTHISFIKLNREGIVDELKHSTQKLSTLADQPHSAVAYPYGEYSQTAMDVFKQDKRLGFGQHSGVVSFDSPYEALPRFPMSNVYGRMKNFALKVNTLAFPIEQYSPQDPRILAVNPPSLEITFREHSDFNSSQLNCFVAGQNPPKMTWNHHTVKITAQEKLPEGRTKYNCTAPSKTQRGRYYWFSQQFIH